MAFTFAASSSRIVSIGIAVPSAKIENAKLCMNRGGHRFVVSCGDAKTKSKSKRSSTSTSTSTSGSKRGGGGGLLRPVPVSPAMQEFLGVPESSRTEALKKIWDYIKQNDLQDPSNKREIICDDNLKRIFGGKDRVGFLEVSGLMNSHFLKKDASE